MDFYKANLLQIKFHRSPSRWMYFRLANASTLWFLWFEITWRRHWLPQAAYMEGWNAAFRQFHGIDESGRTKRAPDAAPLCPECGEPFDFCAMGHYNRHETRRR